jgi:Beta-propeller repeat
MVRSVQQVVRAAAGLGVVVVTLAACTYGHPASTRSGPDFHLRAVERATPASPGFDGNREQVLDAYANLPIAFVENRGQADSRVRYFAQGSRYAFYLTRDEVVLSFEERSGAPSSIPGAQRSDSPTVVTAAVVKEPATQGVALALRFLGGNPQVVVEGEARAPGAVNYFHGKDPAGWRTGIPRYAQVAYRELWPGVDLRLHERTGALKYEFRVRAGARPSDIRLAYTGATGLSVDGSGALLIETGMGTLRDSPPVSYQMINGRRVPVESRYVLIEGTADAAQYGFAVGASYEPDHELIIDPGLEYSTFIGGASHEVAAGIQVDAAGNAFVVGTTQSPNFPTTAGAFKRTGAVNNFSEVFVTKLNPTGTALVYSTFIGGSDLDFGRRIAIDAAGNAYITGQTKSANFPTTANAFDRSFNIPANCPRCVADNYDTFVTKLNAAGSALVYSTFLGGTDIDDAHGIAVDGAGNAYVMGETVSSDFPTTAGAFSRTNRGAYDVYVTKLNATGSALVYSTYLGGTQVDNGERISVDASGNAYVMGFTSSTDFPTTPGAFDTTANGGFDVFVTKLNAAGSALIYSTYLGGSDFDSGGGLAIDSAGNAYISGATSSLDFPTTPGAFDTLADGSEAFVTKLNPAGSALVYSTLLGGSASDGASAIAVDGGGNAWVTGSTTSVDFPTIVGAADSSYNGMTDAFIAELNANGSTLLYSTYLGGSNSESGSDIALDASGGVYVVGLTFSIDFPTTLGAFDTVWNGDLLVFWGDAFVTKLGAVSTPPSTPPVPDAPGLLAPANNDTPPQPITFQWSIASGAVSYTIQIDDSSAFSAPLVREQQNITTLLMYATTGLATTQQFWRVRGVNTDGVAGPWSAVRSFTPQAAPPPATLSTFSTNPSTVAGGSPSSGTVVLSVGAPFGGALISLTSSNPAAATVPATVLAPENSFTGTFTIATSPVAASTTVTITAAYNGSTRTATLTVTPNSPLPGLQSVMLNSPVENSQGSQGSVILSSIAPPGGATVSLSSSNPVIASVPSFVTVLPGNLSALFAIPTTTVTTSTAVTISATYNGTTRTAVLTVNPAAAPPPPPQTAALTVTASGRSGTTVTSSPAGISVTVGSSGSATFATSTQITLSVSGGRTAIWTGTCSSGGSKKASCTFTLTGTATVTASVQ